MTCEMTMIGRWAALLMFSNLIVYLSDSFHQIMLVLCSVYIEYMCVGREKMDMSPIFSLSEKWYIFLLVQVQLT